jgi:hypothetical protein
LETSPWQLANLALLCHKYRQLLFTLIMRENSLVQLLEQRCGNQEYGKRQPEGKKQIQRWGCLNRKDSFGCLSKYDLDCSGRRYRAIDEVPWL